MPDTTDIKVDIESLRKDIENMNTINGRIDTAIDKLTDVSTSIKSMLAVHEEKIARQEKIDEVIFDCEQTPNKHEQIINNKSSRFVDGLT